jgi:hypothetical protein
MQGTGLAGANGAPAVFYSTYRLFSVVMGVKSFRHVWSCDLTLISHSSTFP